MSMMPTTEILTHLVGCPTVSGDSNLPLIDWVRNFLADHGIDAHLVRNDSGTKSNLYATVGPMEEGGLVLSGHTDVVPIDGQSWNTDPFTLTVRGPRLHGRGTCDMKGFIAAALSRIPVWNTSPLSRPIHLLFSYDEEVGCLGAPSMIAAAKAHLPAPAAVIVGEPTGMRIATRHKGICTLSTRVTGVEAHSSLTQQGESAVMLAAELIHHLREIALERARTNQAGSPFDPPYTTLSVNRIGGGTAINILAATCEFGWDIRAIPGDRPQDIVDSFAAFANSRLEALTQSGKHCTITTELNADAPALDADAGLAERLASAAFDSPAAPIAVPYATEGGQFQRAGWSTVICGPGHIEQAHRPDEFIERSQLEACERFLDRIVKRQCTA